MTTIIFLIVLAVLIFVHELGHFLLARLNGIRVDAFKIGFGPRIFSWKRGETEYGLNLIPFGGFVKIFGENPDEENTNGPDRGRSFVHKNRWKQVSVLVAGVFFNFVFAWLVYFVVFVSGVTVTTDSFDGYSTRFRDQRVLIARVETGSPADKAGLKMGDTLISVGPAKTISEVQAYINTSGQKPVKVDYLRNSEAKTLEVVPVQGLVSDRYAIGIAMSEVADLRLPLFASIGESFNYTVQMIGSTAVGLYDFVANIFRGTANFADVSGPVGIAGIVGDAASLGFKYLLMITALISINLGVINLVPFPALDGGRILFVAIEGIIRRRISPKFGNAVNVVGFALLMILMVAVTYKDIAKLVH